MSAPLEQHGLGFVQLDVPQHQEGIPSVEAGGSGEDEAESGEKHPVEGPGSAARALARSGCGSAHRSACRGRPFINLAHPFTFLIFIKKTG